jgi:2-polyprenyl-3-methyl-5-hydroxy-6-metoxy-1,4-benzoquinol methylase
MHAPKCRFCKSELTVTFADLGMSPMSNSYVSPDRAALMEPFYPLHAYVCSECLLVQLEEFESPEEIFSDYAYFSSYSSSWLQHARDYVGMMSERFGLCANTHVVELASNDGYLLQYFLERGMSVLGVEPAANVAGVAIDKGVRTEIAFFGVETAKRLAQRQRADVLLGNNVLAHVPDINDFVAGIKILLAPNGVVTMEFPHLLRLIEGNQFDTIYHEHFSYLSLLTAERVFARHGLRLFDVEELSTHGGSIRIFACHQEHSRPSTGRVDALKEVEAEAGLYDLDTYRAFDARVKQTKLKLLTFLVEAKRAKKKIVAYGAPAKGNTLLNYCGVRTDFIEFTVDKNPHKQNHFLPGTRIPIRDPSALADARPDYVLILPWNIRDEIMNETRYIRDWGGQFLVPIPEVQISV